jgi:hypothetical protein
MDTAPSLCRGGFYSYMVRRISSSEKHQQTDRQQKEGAHPGEMDRAPS